MAVDATQLRAELNNVPAATVSDTVLSNCVSVANELLKQYAGATYLTDLPTVIAEKAWLAVAVELFNQRRAPNGVLTQQFSTPDGGASVPVRIGADPLRPAYGLLSRWITDMGFA
ncbi:hypothetical protein [Nocardioides panaciterrulae]|uniref:Uncharacterized protein n=1 Tax=Nocardioides panaciterrulae TaxID=661492 RepID=A0A7Y9JCI0_9ACTN|nr:hypothetical protein [Nocardioides panaciterrulae]NYD43936.1 hypothetical protein [Nocardioides panaciterrulae]NYD44005.1 hypothetical protein [Nocardioides panaciterrulae]